MNTDVITIGADRDILNDNSRTFEERQKELEEIGKLKAEIRDLEKRNSNFVMLFRESMPEFGWLIQKSGISARIFAFILEHMDTTNALICPAQILIDRFDISLSTVRRCMKLLYDNGFIDILKSGSSNVYVVNHAVAWTSWESGKQYCQFDGKILVSKTENADYIYRSQFDKFKQLRAREDIK